jgi:hypothetical protein
LTLTARSAQATLTAPFAFEIVGVGASLTFPPAVALCANMPQCHRPRQRKSMLARPVETTAAFGGR